MVRDEQEWVSESTFSLNTVAVVEAKCSRQREECGRVLESAYLGLM